MVIIHIVPHGLKVSMTIDEHPFSVVRDFADSADSARLLDLLQLMSTQTGTIKQLHDFAKKQHLL